MKKLFQLIVVIGISFSMNSCYYDSIYEPVVIDDPNEEPTVISYQDDIIPLWAQCVGCHNGNTPPNFSDDVSYGELLDGYVVSGNADASILYKSLLGIDGVSLMPPGSPWSDAKINAVKDWIDQGAENN